MFNMSYIVKADKNKEVVNITGSQQIFTIVDPYYLRTESCLLLLKESKSDRTQSGGS